MSRFAVVVGMLAFASLAFAQPEGGRPHMQMHQQLMEQLKLTDQQKTEMQKLRLEMEKQQVQIQAKIRLQRIDLRELFAAEKPDRAAIEKGIRAVSDLQLQEKMNMVNHLFSVNALLTPDQQKIFKKTIGERLGAFSGEMRALRGRMRGLRHEGRGMQPERGMQPSPGME